MSFNLAPGVALGDAVDAIAKAEAQIKLPACIRGTFQGTAQAFQDSLKNEGFLIMFALFAVYIVLGILYEVTYIRSRFSRRCLRPASAHFSRYYCSTSS